MARGAGRGLHHGQPRARAERRADAAPVAVQRVPAVDARHALARLGATHERRQATHLLTRPRPRAGRPRPRAGRRRRCGRRAARGRLRLGLELGIGPEALELPAEVGLRVEVAPELRLERAAREPRPHLDGQRAVRSSLDEALVESLQGRAHCPEERRANCRARPCRDARQQRRPHGGACGVCAAAAFSAAAVVGGGGGGGLRRGGLRRGDGLPAVVEDERARGGARRAQRAQPAQHATRLHLGVECVPRAPCELFHARRQHLA